MAMSENALNFRLSFYISDVGNKLSIQTEVYTLIIEKFRERNIKIPFPQRVLHVQNKSDLQEADILVD
jgi:small-conductance mechanosensitive channel